MRIIGWMLTRMIVIRFLFVLFGISIFVITLDIVAYPTEILGLNHNAFRAISGYFLMRSPFVLATFLPMTELLALLRTLTEHSYRNQTPAISSPGVSSQRLM